MRRYYWNELNDAIGRDDYGRDVFDFDCLIEANSSPVELWTLSSGSDELVDTC